MRSDRATLLLLVLSAVGVVSTGGCRSPAGGGRGNGNGIGKGSALEGLGGVARLRAQYESIDTGDSRERLLTREELELRAAGRVGDARLLRYSLMGAIAGAQFREAGAGSEADIFNRYDARLSILPLNPVSAQVWARLDEDVAFVNFLDSLGVQDRRREERGGLLGWRGKEARAELEGTTVDGETRGINGTRSSSEDRVSASFFWDPDPRRSLRVSAAREDRAESTDGEDFTYTLESLWAQARFRDLSGTGEERSSVQVEAEARRQLGDFDFDQDRLSVRFQGRPSEAMNLGTGLRLGRSGSGGDDLRTVAWDGNLGHKLYRSLDTRVAGHFSRQFEDRGEIDDFGGSAGLGYRKETALGLLTGGAARGRHILDERVPGGFSTVLREPHTLSSAGLEFLVHFDVVEDSVVVREAAGPVVYVRGLDYDLQRRGRRTEIFRLPGSTAPEGASVLVDYSHEVPGGRRVRTDTTSLDLGLHPWPWLHLFNRISWSRQTLEEGAVSGALEDFTHMSTGADFQEGILTAGVSREDHDSNIAPYLEHAARARVGGDIADGTSGSLGCGYSRTSFEEGDDLRTFQVDGRLSASLSPRASLTFTPGYRSEKGRGDDRNLLDLRLELRYSVRAVDVKFSIFRQTSSLHGDRRESSFVDLTIERWF